MEEKLVPIKDFVSVSDVSFYIFLALALGLFLLILAGALWLVSAIKNRKKTPIYKAKKILNELDFKDAKKSSYAISKYGFILAQNDLSKEFLVELNKRLEKYKYQKTVPNMSQEDRAEFVKFMELCDV